MCHRFHKKISSTTALNNDNSWWLVTVFENSEWTMICDKENDYKGRACGKTKRVTRHRFLRSPTQG